MHTKMNPTVRQLWVDDLLANPNLQGKGALHRVTPDGDEFCCLGRLCVLAVQAGVIDEPRPNVDDPNDHAMYYSGHSATLPEAVCVWAGLYETLPEYSMTPIDNVAGSFTLETGSTDSLASHNDGGKTFLAIAETIEHYF